MCVVIELQEQRHKLDLPYIPFSGQSTKHQSWSQQDGYRETTEMALQSFFASLSAFLTHSIPPPCSVLPQDPLCTASLL